MWPFISSIPNSDLIKGNSNLRQPDVLHIYRNKEREYSLMEHPLLVMTPNDSLTNKGANFICIVQLNACYVKESESHLILAICCQYVREKSLPFWKYIHCVHSTLSEGTKKYSITLGRMLIKPSSQREKWALSKNQVQCSHMRKHVLVHTRTLSSCKCIFASVQHLKEGWPDQLEDKSILQLLSERPKNDLKIGMGRLWEIIGSTYLKWRYTVKVWYKNGRYW